jgi:hypothetical protein
VILFAPLAVFLIGMLAFAITASNYYYGQAQQQSTGSLFKSIITGSFYLKLIGKAANRLFTRTLTSWMGQAAAAVDANVGTTFHYLASEVRNAANTMLAFGSFTLTVAGVLTGQASWSDVRHALANLRRQLKADVHKADVALQHSIAQEKAAVRSVAEGVYPRLKGLEHEVDRTIPREIKAVRDLAREAEDRAVKSAKWLRKHERSLVASTFAGAVAWALGHLGLSWTRCATNPFNNNPKACSLWKDLAGLLAGAGLFGAALDFRDIVKAAVALEKEGAQAVAGLTVLSEDAIHDAAQAVADAANAIAT